jgi:hypothetical protein
MRFRALIAPALAAAVLCADSAPAHAQLGGLIRRGVQAASRGSTPPAAAPAAQPAGGGDDEVAAHRARIANAGILEMNAANLDRMMLALRTERAYMDSIAAVKRAAKTPEQYGQCMMQVYTTSPALQAVNDSVQILVERQDMNGVARMGERQQAIIRTSCGISADDVQKLEQEAGRERNKRAKDAAGFQGYEYAYLKERLTPFCAIAATVAPGEVRIPGDGRGIFWVYSPVEAEQLKARCGELTAAVNAVS